jgi:hypothetical protein
MTFLKRYGTIVTYMINVSKITIEKMPSALMITLLTPELHLADVSVISVFLLKGIVQRILREVNNELK